MGPDGIEHNKNTSVLYPHSSTELIAIVAGVLYASGFLAATAFCVRLGIQGSGVEFFKAKYIQTGILFFLFPAGVILPVILRLYLVEPSKANVKQARQIVHQRCTLIFIPSVLSILYFLTAFAHVKFIFDNTEFIFWFLSIAALTISCGTFLNQIAVDGLSYFAWVVIFDVALYTGINIMVFLANDSSAPLSSVTLETGIYYQIWILIAVIIVTYGDFGGTQLRADKSVGLTVASKGNEATEFAGVSKNAPANLAAVKPQDRLAASALCACLVGVLWFISLFFVQLRRVSVDSFFERWRSVEQS
jgi:hypothetical protein